MDEMRFYPTEDIVLMDTNDGAIQVNQGNFSYTIADQPSVQHQVVVQQTSPVQQQRMLIPQQQQMTSQMGQQQTNQQQMNQQPMTQQQMNQQQMGQQQMNQQQIGQQQQMSQQQMSQQQMNPQQMGQQQMNQQQIGQQQQMNQQQMGQQQMNQQQMGQQQMNQQQMGQQQMNPNQRNQQMGQQHLNQQQTINLQQQTLYTQPQQHYIVQRQPTQVVVQHPMVQGQLIQQQSMHAPQQQQMVVQGQQPQQQLIMQPQIISQQQQQQQQQLVVQQQQHGIGGKPHTFIIAPSTPMSKQGQVIQYYNSPAPGQGQLIQQISTSRSDGTGSDGTLRKVSTGGPQQIMQISVPPPQHHFQQQQQGGQIISAQLLSQDNSQPQQITYIHPAVKHPDRVHYQLRLAAPNAGGSPVQSVAGGIVSPTMAGGMARPGFMRQQRPATSMPDQQQSNVICSTPTSVQQQTAVNVTSTTVEQQKKGPMGGRQPQGGRIRHTTPQLNSSMRHSSPNIISSGTQNVVVQSRAGVSQTMVQRTPTSCGPNQQMGQRVSLLGNGPRMAHPIRGSRMVGPQQPHSIRAPMMNNAQPQRMPRYSQPGMQQQPLQQDENNSSSSPAVTSPNTTLAVTSTSATILYTEVEDCNQMQTVVTTDSTIVSQGQQIVTTTQGPHQVLYASQSDCESSNAESPCNSSSPSTSYASTNVSTTVAVSSASNTPKKISLEQYRNLKQQQGIPLQQGHRIVQQPGMVHHGGPQPHFINTIAPHKGQPTTKQVLYVVNSGSRPMMGSTISQHPVLKLHHESSQQVTSSDSSPNKEQGSGGSLRYHPGHQVLCNNCGVASDDFHNCQHCRAPLPKTARVIPSSNNSTNTSGGPMYITTSGILSKQEFYGDSGGGRRQEKHNTYSRANNKHAPRGRGRGRTRAYDEPEILTLSSDEEDSNKSGVGNHGNSGSPGDKSSPNSGSVSLQPLGGLEALAGKMANISAKEPVIKPVTESTEVNSSDAGKMASFNPSNSDRHCKLMCRNLRIGSYKTVPTSGVYFAPEGIRFSVPSVSGSEGVEINIDLENIVKILYHFGKQMPVLYLYLKAEAAFKIRTTLAMINTSSNYYDPASQDETLKRIVIMPEVVCEEIKAIIKGMYGVVESSNIDKSNSSSLSLNSSSNGDLTISSDSTQGAPLMEELTYDEANAILVTSSAPEVQAVVKMTSKAVSNTGPSHHNSHQSKTLLIYPPPPQKGGISVTIDDYQVLEEESFLNDVILDFYLKWLQANKIPDGVKEKVHIFSTFFYKRLTCKPKKMRRFHPVEDNPKLSAAEKRHDRVKSWTKSVDIFDKDYIIIPINEHAHWFLAIICFPGLKGPVHFETGEPIAEGVLPDESAAQRRRSARSRCRPEQIPVIDDGEWSDRDEAEGDEDELEEDDDEEDDSSMQPSRKKVKVNGASSESIPGLEETADTTSTTPAPPKIPPIKQPCILIFDSLSGGQRARIVATLRDYLAVEYKRKKNEVRVFNRDTMKGACPKVPQQTNYSDCGLYTLQFTESFFELPLQDYRFPIRHIGSWFDQSIVAGKREYIALLIKSLMNEYNPNNNIKLPDIYFNTPEERQRGGRASCQVEERERAERLALEKSREKAALRHHRVEVAAPNGRGPVNTEDKLAEDGTRMLPRGEKRSSPFDNLLGKGKANNNSAKSVDDKKKEEGNNTKSENCTKPVTISNSVENNNKGNGKPLNQIISTYSKLGSGNKPTLIRPGSNNSDSTKSQQQKISIDNNKSKKLVLGSIPVAQPFGSSQQLPTRVQSQSNRPNSGTLALREARVTSTHSNLLSKTNSDALSAIRDCYSFDDTEDNNNEPEGDIKHRAVNNNIQSTSVVQTSGDVVVRVSQGVGQLCKSLKANNSVSTTASNSDACDVQVNDTSSNNVSRKQSASVPPTTTTRTKLLQPQFSQNSKVGCLTTSTTVSSGSLLKSNNEKLKSSSAPARPPNNLKGRGAVNALSGNNSQSESNDFHIGITAGKKAVLHDNEVFMYLNEEGNQTGARVAKADSPPDIYSGLDPAVPSTEEDNVDLMDTQLGQPSSQLNSASSADGSGASGNNSDASPAHGSSSSLAPPCFKFSAKATSSGRTIAPPKRYLESQPSSDVGKRKKRVARGGNYQNVGGAGGMSR